MNNKIYVIFSLASFLVFGSVFAYSSSFLAPSFDGNFAQWTPKTGSSHFAMVDDAYNCNGTTDYNSTNTVGDRDSYGVNLSPVPDGSIITQIEIQPCASKNSNGGPNSIMDVFYRYNGADSLDAGNYSLSGNIPTTLGITPYSGLSLLKGSTSTFEVGSVLKSGRRGARLSRITTRFTFDSLNTPTNLVGSVFGSSAVLEWTDNSLVEDGFKIERSVASTSWSQIDTVGANVTTYTDNGLTPGVHYLYKVRAYNSAADSYPSYIVEVVP